MDPRYLIYFAWALATLIVWGLVLHRDFQAYRDRYRYLAVGDLASDLALFAAAVAAAISLVVLILGQDVPGLRGFCLAVFLGGFLGAGIFKLTSRRR